MSPSKPFFAFSAMAVPRCGDGHSARLDRFEPGDKGRGIAGNRNLFQPTLRAGDNARARGRRAQSIRQQRAQSLIGFAVLRGAAHARREHARPVGKLSHAIDRVTPALRRQTA
jgi:hypothetical protein